MSFDKKGKLSPPYIGQCRISKRIDNVAYKMELPSKLAKVHLVFHIWTLKKYKGSLSLIIPTKNIGIKDNLYFEDIPVSNLDRRFTCWGPRR